MKSYYQCWPVNLVILTASSLPLPLYHLPFILESYFSFLNSRVVTHWIFLSVCSFDGVPFLMHDSTLKRTTNIAEVFPNRTHLDASMFTWTELQQLNAGDWFLSVWPARTQLNTEQQQHVVGLEMHHLYRNYWRNTFLQIFRIHKCCLSSCWQWLTDKQLSQRKRQKMSL